MIPEGMFQPKQLRQEEFQPWSRGRGVDVWAMIVAAINGDVETMKTLVARDPGLVNCEYEYFTPLTFAVRENQRAVIDFLLEKGINPIHFIGEDLVAMAADRGYTQLEQFLTGFLRDRFHILPEGSAVAEAIKAFDLPRVRALIGGRGELVHAADGRGNQPIHWAVLTRQIDVIDYLLEQGANIEAVRPDGAKPMDLTNGDYFYRSWYRDLPAWGLRKHEVLIGYLMGKGAYCDISVAAKCGYYQRVRELLDEDPEVANRLPLHLGYNGLPLRNAAGAGYMEIVKLLLHRGADVNGAEPGVAPFGGALHSAVAGKHFEIARLLLEHGADANAMVESSGDVLFMARHVGAPQDMIDLIASHANKRAVDIVAYETDENELRRRLEADASADVGAFLSRLIEKDQRDQLELILRYQPDFLRGIKEDDAAWWDGTSFHSAEQARWLFERGYDPRLRNWLGITRLHRCAVRGETEIAAASLEFGADINAVETHWSSTPLGWAAREGKKEMVEWLLAAGADPRVPADRPWAWPVEWARRRGHGEIVEVLVRA